MRFGDGLKSKRHDFQSEEFAIRAKALSPAEVIRSATRVNAEILGRAGELGIIAVGALADLLVLDGDPLQDLALLADPESSLRLIMKGGRVVRDRL